MTDFTTTSSGKFRRRIAQEQRRLRHRLLSIFSDASFVRYISDQHLNFPVFANLRCGLWYARVAGICTDTAYFKSTDGHANTWNFSLRRLNLNVVEAASNSPGILLVDATKRGRRMPDSFSRTVPIWCTVINRAVHRHREQKIIGGVVGDSSGERVDRSTSTKSHNISTKQENNFWDTELHIPPNVVSKEESAIISSKLDYLVDSLVDSDAVDIDWLSGILKNRPLRTFWITTESTIIEDLKPDYTCNGKYSPIICISASEPIEDTQFRVFNAYSSTNMVNTEKQYDRHYSTGGNEDVGFFYIPGAGDDHEKWSCGLTPDLMYQHLTSLLQSCRDGDDACETLVGDIVSDVDGCEIAGMGLSGDGGSISSNGSDNKESLGNYHKLGNTTLYVGTRRAGRPPECWEHFDAIVNATVKSYDGMKTMMVDNENNSSNSSNSNTLERYLHVPIPEGKRDSDEILLTSMPKVLCFILLHLAQSHRILVHCNQGIDRSVGIAAAACSLFVHRKGHTFLNIHHWCRNATLESLGEMRRQTLYSKDGSIHRTGNVVHSRCIFFKWLNELIRSNTDGNSSTSINVVNKKILRSTLVAISRYRHVASPSRYTMRKLSRFFTEHGKRLQDDLVH
jgi:tRNA A64-2'-O-ribosylphosphate transferase